jgi:hypothetical protein
VVVDVHAEQEGEDEWLEANPNHRPVDDGPSGEEEDSEEAGED